MIHKNVLTGIILLLTLITTGVTAQKLIIRLDNGAENPELLSSIQKLYFSGNDLVIDFKSGA